MSVSMPVIALTTAQIGKCGELLVQQRLLKYAIESAPMATDAGIDLLAYSSASRCTRTIQVKTNLRPKPAGGKGAMGLDWWIPQDSPAELFALADLESDRVWLFSYDEISRVAQQKPQGRMHFYMYSDTAIWPRDAGKHTREFDAYRIENRILEIFRERSSDIRLTSSAQAEVANMA